MEDLISRPSWNKMSQVDDPKLRMATRPKGASTTKHVKSRRTGMAAEDFGSSFPVKKPKGSKVPSRKNQETIDSDLDSSDELDTIASSRASSRAGSVVAQEKGSKNNGFTDKEGTYHEYHPAYSQSTNVLKKLKFNKIKPSQGDADQPLDASSSKPMNHSDTMDRHTSSIFKPAPLPDPAVARTRREPSLERKTRKRSLSPVRPPSQATKIPPSTSQPSRPKPRPLVKKTSSATLGPKEFPGLSPSRSPARRMTISGSPTRSPLFSENDASMEPSPPRKMKAKEFPLMATPKVSSTFPPIKKPFAASRSVSDMVITPKRLPSTKDKKEESAEARIRRRISNTPKAPKIILSSEESDDNEDPTKEEQAPKAQPFPMSTQVLDSIGSSPPTAGPSYLKRSPPPIYDEPESKRMKEDAFNISFSGEREEKEIDPKKLCPYCDSPLPAQPTSKLKRMLALAKKKSKPEPRLGNSLGRTAPFTIYIALCQRHQFESQMLPEAERKGWPQEIDWSNLGKRVRKMKSLLRAIIEDSGDAQLDDFLGEETGSRPRARCVFWREALEEVKKKGARAAAGVHAQFATFDKTQPGYYGEMGFAIIHQTLYDLFPPASIDPDLVFPLTATEFFQRVMVPEIGTRLIMQDMDFNEGQMEEAIKILRDSATYGVAMFPVDEEEAKGDSDDADLGAADMIVMERARKRRKELDETGRVDEKEYQKQTKKAESAKKQAGGNKLGKKNREESEDEVDIPAQRPKPRPRGKNLDNASVRNLEIASAVADADRQGEATVQVPPRPKPRPLGKNTSSVSMRDVEMPSSLSSLGVDHTPKPDQAQKKVQDSFNSDHFGSPEAERTPMPRSKSRLRTSRSTANSNKYSDTDGAPSRPMPANLSDIDIDPCTTEDSTDDDWDTGRMPKPQKKCRGKNKSSHVELSDDDVPQAVPPSSSSSSRTTFPIGSHDRKLDDSGHGTPKSHEKFKTLDTIPPLQRARERKQKSTSHAKPKRNEHSWLLSDHSHSSMESIQS